MKKIIIINPFGIGDVLFTTPVARAIKDSGADTFIGYWCNERVEPILRNNHHIDKIFALSRGDLKRIYHESRWEGIYKFLNLMHNIKKERFDISLDFSLDHRYSLISKLLGIKKRIGFNYKSRGRFLTDKIDIDGYNDKHAVKYYLDVLKFLDIKPQDNHLELMVTEQASCKAQDLLKAQGIGNDDLLVGIAAGAGASWGRDASFKHWPARSFGRLADRVIGELGAKILILGDESERHIADTLLTAMDNKPIDLAGKTNLGELIAIIDNLDVLVTNDGGPLHIAVALGVKTVSIFGPVDEKVYGPYPPSDKHIVIKKDLNCRPCYKKFRMPVCDKDRECINSISTEEVFGAIRRQL